MRDHTRTYVTVVRSNYFICSKYCGEKTKIGFFENRILRRIFAQPVKEVTRGWCNEVESEERRNAYRILEGKSDQKRPQT